MKLNNNMNAGSAEGKDKLFEMLLKKKGIVAAQADYIPRRHKAERYELSSSQQRLWFLHQFDRESPAYNIPLVVQIKGLLSVKALEKSINEIIKRHEAIRTIFIETDGQPAQIVSDQADISIDIVQLEELMSKEDIARLASAEMTKPFDLSKGPLIRALLFRSHEELHILVITMHHIITDGWSLGIFIKEVAALYDSFVNSKPVFLPELPVQYADYAVWQHKWLQSEKAKTQLEYWRNRLEGAAPFLELPTDFQRPLVQTSKGSIYKFELNEEDVRKLDALCRSEGITLFMALMAVFIVLLYRYTMQEDILVGTPVSGRNQKDIENLIGFFVNTIVIRAKLNPELTYRELAGIIKEDAIKAFANQDIPFEKVVEELRIERNLQYTPVFQTMFTYQNAPIPEISMAGLTIEPFSIDGGYAQFDLSMTIWKEGHRPVGTIEYNTDLFMPSTIERMAKHYNTLIKSACNNPDVNITKLEMLSENERLQLTNGWNKTNEPYPKDKCLSHLFEEQAGKTPDGVAVIFNGSCLTYRELDQKSSKLAHYLIKRGVGPEIKVAICADCSLELIIGILGIIKAGGAYVPLEPGYPKERIRYILDDTNARIVLTQNGVSGNFAGWDLEVICLDTGWDKISQEENEFTGVNKFSSESLACVIYTSGTSGNPKGVMLENKSLVNLITSFIRCYQVSEKDRILPLTSVASASFVGEIFPLICAGGTLVLADKTNYLNFEMLMDFITENRITIISTVPSVIVRMNAEDIKPSSIRLILSGGEPLLPSNINNLINSTTIVNGYGLTEATVCTTFQILNPENYDMYPIVPIGRPIMNSRVYILDQGMNCVPVGCRGEIYVAGDGLARGYINNPGLTAERFIPNPFSAGERMYKTGDLACWLPDGNIKYIGRADKQVKIRGYRIEIEEIENKINQHPAVETSCVAVREDEPGDRRLVAYMVLREAMNASSREMRSWLIGRLPEYMIPSAYEVMDELPLNANGKVDMALLPAPNRKRPDLNNIFEIPETEIEQMIADIWKEVLHIDSVGVNDNFFDLGGHSLLITRVHSRLRKLVDKELSIVDFFKYPTIRLLAEYIRQPAGGVCCMNGVNARAEKQRNAMIRNRNRKNMIDFRRKSNE